MNCRDVERLGFDAQESSLDDSQRAALAQHLLTCDACRQAGGRIRTAIDAWRSTTACAPLPDVSREWQVVRRRRRAPTDNAAADSRPRPSPLLAWLAIPLAAAAIVIALFLSPHRPPSSPSDGTRDALARVQPADDSATAPTVVFVDEKSGWLVVWAADQADQI